MPPHLPAAVLWDMDGTLVDSEHYWIAEEFALVESFGGQWSLDHAHELVGSALLDSAAYIIEHTPVTLTPEAVVDRLVAGVALRLALIRLVLPELFLRGGDDAEVMLGVLIEILGGDRIARAQRIAGELNVFLGKMRGGAANLDLGAVRFVDAGHRILTAPVVVHVVAVVIITTTHALLVVVVLPVSHFVLLISLEVEV